MKNHKRRLYAAAPQITIKQMLTAKMSQPDSGRLRYKSTFTSPCLQCVCNSYNPLNQKTLISNSCAWSVFANVWLHMSLPCKGWRKGVVDKFLFVWLCVCILYLICCFFLALPCPIRFSALEYLTDCTPRCGARVGARIVAEQMSEI